MKGVTYPLRDLPPDVLFAIALLAALTDQVVQWHGLAKRDEDVVTPPRQASLERHDVAHPCGTSAGFALCFPHLGRRVLKGMMWPSPAACYCRPQASGPQSVGGRRTQNVRQSCTPRAGGVGDQVGCEVRRTAVIEWQNDRCPARLATTPRRSRLLRWCPHGQFGWTLAEQLIRRRRVRTRALHRGGTNF